MEVFLKRYFYLVFIIIVTFITLHSKENCRFFRHLNIKENYEYQFQNEVSDTLAYKSFCYYVKYDSLSRPIQIEYRKMGALRLTNTNFAINKIFYDKNQIRMEFYNEKDQRTYLNYGYVHSILLELENDKIVLASFYDINGNQVLNAKHGYYTKVEYSDKSDDIWISYLDKSKKIIPVENVFKTKFSYNNQGKCILMINYDKFGRVQEDFNMIAKIQTKYAKKGRMEKKFFFNQFDEQIEIAPNALVGRGHVFSYNNQYKINLYHSISGTLTTYDKNGYVTSIGYFDINNKYTHDKYDVAIYKYKTNLQGQLIEKTCFNGHNVATENKFGYHKTKYFYDNKGNQIEEVYYRMFDRLFDHKNITSSIKSEYDDYGNQIKEIYYDFENEIITFSDICGFSYEYDRFGNIVKKGFLNSKGEEFVYNHYYSHEAWEYNERNDLIAKKYLTLDNTLGTTKFVWAYKKMEHNYIENSCEISFYNKKIFSKKIKQIAIGGYYYCKNFYNDMDLLIKMECLGKDKKLTCNDLGYSKEVYNYDQYGNVIENCFYNENDELVIPQYKTFAKLVQSFDSNNYKIRKELYDDLNNPTEDDDGVFSWVRIVDERGNVTEMKYFDKDKKLVCPKGKYYAHYIKRYNESGELVEKKNFNASGGLVEDKYGIAAFKIFYIADDKREEIRFFNANDELIESDLDGSAKIKYIYDDDLNLIEIHFLDKNDNQVNVKRGFYQVSCIKYNYNYNGIKFEKEYYDKKGKFLKKFKFGRRAMLADEIDSFLQRE